MSTFGFDNFQKLGQDNVAFAMKSAEAFTKGIQAIATEAGEYSRRSFDAGAAAFGKLTAAKSVDTAVAVQSDFAKAAYDAYVAQVTRMGEIVADMATSAAEPYQAFFARSAK